MLLLALGLKRSKTRLLSKLKVKRQDGLLLALFYAAVGVAQIIVLAETNLRLFPSGALAVLSFITAYGLFTVKKWSVWLVIGLFFPQLVFGVVTLYASIVWYSFSPQVSFLLLGVLLVLFIVLSLVSFVYVATKRKTFQKT